MGWVQGKGSSKAPFLVSMKWSGDSGAGTLLRRWGPGESEVSSAMGVLGEHGGSSEWWVQAARRLRVINRRYGWMAPALGSMP